MKAKSLHRNFYKRFTYGGFIQNAFGDKKNVSSVKIIIIANDKINPPYTEAI